MIKPLGDWYLVETDNFGADWRVVACPDTSHFADVGYRLVIDVGHLKTVPAGEFIHRNYVLAVVKD